MAALAALSGCGGGGGGGAAASPTSGSASLSSGVITSSAPTGTSSLPDVASPGVITSSAATGTSTVPNAAPPSGSRLAIGVNIHTGGGTTAANDQIASIMANRNFKQARLDLFPASDYTMLRDQVAKINANGGKAQLVVENSYQWDNSCNQNLAAVEQDAYNQTLQMVGAMKDLVHDFEILNEIQIRPDVGGQVQWNAQGSSTAGYDNSACAHTLATVARGMSRAIHDQGQRAILGALGRDWGFLTFMQQQGVTWDMTGFHIYPHYGDPSLQSDPWYGSGGPLVNLASFGKPITINEFHCGEIYDSGYEDQAGMPVTETCIKSLNKHLGELRTATQSVESVVVYELLNEPSKGAPENRFGLRSDLNTPKVQEYVTTAYAGGNLTAAEQGTITSRGLLTDAQIAAMK